MHGECATGGQFPVQVVSLCVDLVLVAGVSMRAAPRVLELLGSLLGGSLAVDYGSVRTWLLRLGLFAFEGPKEQADDWALLIDHTVQLGACKCLVIVAVRLSRAPYPKRCLRYDDLEPIAVVPMEHSTGEAVHRELERVVDRIGVPRLIVSDHGSDVKKGIERFREQHPTTATTYDMAHKGACLLKHRLGADPRHYPSHFPPAAIELVHSSDHGAAEKGIASNSGHKLAAIKSLFKNLLRGPRASEKTG